MKNSLLLTITLFLSSYLLSACNEQANPLVGQWQQVSPSTGLPGQTVEFTPSTMLINDTRVTVVYQIRENKIRVSASKNEIIYAHASCFLPNEYRISTEAKRDSL